MPYSGIDDPKLPKDVQAASEVQRKRFVSAFNSAYGECKEGDCEGQAFRIARSAMSEKMTIETYLKTLDDIKDDIKALPTCERCNAVLDESAKSLAGMQLCENCNGELTKAVIAENQEALRKHYGGKGILDRLFGVKTQSETGFKALPGNKWVAWYTNARKDLEGENFSYEGLQRDVKRQNETGDYPELWFYHIPGTAHGKATQTFVVKDMVVAVGSFSDSQLAEKMKAYYEKSIDVALSHGFVYDNAKFDGTTYSDFKTFEISTLPRGKEANPFTKFGLLEIKAMEVKISEDQKQALEAALGADLAGQVISKSPDSFQKATKDLEGVISYKADMMDEEDDTEEDGKKPPYKKSADDTPAEMGSAIRDIANAVVKALEPQNEAQTKSIEMLSEAVKALHERLVQVEGKPKQKEMPHNPDITAILKDQKSGNEGDIQAANPTMGVVQKLYRPKQ